MRLWFLSTFLCESFDLFLCLLDLGTARTTPLPDRKALEMILEKLQKFVLHIFPFDPKWDLLHWVLMSSILSSFCHCLIPQKGYMRSVCLASGSGGGEIPCSCSLAVLAGVTECWSCYCWLTQSPIYHDVIEHPMDFGTVRRKLARNAYRSFEQFEVRWLLFCHILS